VSDPHRHWATRPGEFVDSGNGQQPFIAETTFRRIIYDYDALHRHAKLCFADSRLLLMKLASSRLKYPEYPEIAQGRSKLPSLPPASQTGLSDCPILIFSSILSIRLPSCLMLQLQHFADGILLLMLIV